MGLYYYDWTYIAFMLPALILTIWAQWKVKSTFAKYSRLRNARGMTGRDAASSVLRENNLSYVTVRHIGGNLNDHFDPRNNSISLSDPVYDAPTIAAVGVAAHEAGHAVQHAEEYGPIRFRNALVPVVQFASNLAMPLILIGMLLPVRYTFFITAGIILFSLTTLFQLVTLPVEFNASARALKAIDQTGMLTEEERAGAKKVLQAAAMTYLAAAFTSLLSLLRLLLIAQRRNRD